MYEGRLYDPADPGITVAVGNPCRVLREIGEHDDKYYWRDKEIDVEIE